MSVDQIGIEMRKQLRKWGNDNGIDNVMQYMHECRVDPMDIIGIPALDQDGKLWWHEPKEPHIVSPDYGIAIRDENGQVRMLRAPS